jgi:mannose-6-phosphate isomerase-like protein (cupin superfamily)
MRIPTRFRPAEIDSAPLPPGRLSKLALSTADMELRHYRPPRPDTQAPHDRDELYIVLSGTAMLDREGERVGCAAGDALFVAKGEKHRFVDATADFATWVVFFGPTRAA